MPHSYPTPPEGYQEVRYLRVTEPGLLVALNVLSLATLAGGGGLIFMWTRFIVQQRSAVPSGPAGIDWLVIVIVPLVFIAHEGLHGLAICWAGQEPRYGAQFASFGPIKIPLLLYATTEGALFSRRAFIVIALVPLVVITAVGMLLVVVIPQGMLFTVNLCVALNAGGAAGDVWMSWVALQHPPNALIKDEADAIRIYEYSV